VTKEERDKREAEKRARMEGSPDIGGVTLPFSRNTLLKVFWAFAIFYPIYTLWSARQDLSFELFFSGMVLYLACLLPAWFWCTGRIQGLPIYPIFAISFLPKYLTPLWQGHTLLVQYTLLEIATAAWTVAGCLLIGMLFWQQMAVRSVGVPQAVRMINLKRAENILLWCVFGELLFESLMLLLYQFGSGGFSAIRGFATAAGRMGIFVFCYQIGQGEISPFKKTVFLLMLSVIVVQETASLVLATVIPTVGLAFAAYVLGSGKVPWKVMAGTLAVLTVLHAGKFEMREKYLFSEDARQAAWHEYPAYFTEWVEHGVRNLGMGKPGEERREVSSVKERGSLIHLMVMIQTMTPAKVPFLEGESYKFIPALLIPRILSPGKAWSHTGNMMLSLHYGILSEEGIWKTSVGFDPVMEAYANYGYLGVLVLAVIIGFFLGWATRLTIHVPMLSFGFMFGVLIIGTAISSFNTMGVYVTSTWQSFLALAALSLVLMSKENNPVWKYYAVKLAEKLRLRPDPKLAKTLDEVSSVLAQDEREKDIGYRISDIERDSGVKGLREEKKEEAGLALGISPNPQSPIPDPAATAAVRHERPTRFVYGQKQNS
jgi:hypothetical protein